MKYIVVQVLIFSDVFNRNSKVQNLRTPIAKLLKKEKKNNFFFLIIKLDYCYFRKFQLI